MNGGFKDDGQKDTLDTLLEVGYYDSLLDEFVIHCICFCLFGDADY